MAISLVVWLISPFVLLPLLISCTKKNRRNEEEIESLKEKVRSLQDIAAQIVPTVTPAEDAPSVEQGCLQNAVAVSSSESEPTSRPVLDAMKSIKETSVDSYTMDETYPAPVVIDIPVNDKKELPSRNKNEITTGSVMFGIGVLFVLIAGTIFATTSWKAMTSVGKLLTLLGTVVVFYVSAAIAQCKLRLRETSVAFFLLGSSFLAVINLGIGFFKWFGSAYELSGQSAFLVWSISLLIMTICFVAGKLLYEISPFGAIGYMTGFGSAILMSQYIFDRFIITVFVMGIYAILSWVYLFYHRTDDTKRIKLPSIVCYIYLVCTTFAPDKSVSYITMTISFVVGVLLIVLMRNVCRRKRDEMALVIYGAAIALLFPAQIIINTRNYALVILFPLAALLYHLIFRFVKYADGRYIGYYHADAFATGLYVISTIVALINLDFLKEGVLLALYVIAIALMGTYIVLFMILDKSEGLKKYLDNANAFLGFIILMLSVERLDDVTGNKLWMLSVCFIALIIYYCIDIQSSNISAVFPAAIFYIYSFDLIETICGDNHFAKRLIVAIVVIAISLVMRFRYKKVVSKQEGIIIDWLGTASFIMVMGLIGVKDNTFAVFALMALYFANFHKRTTRVDSRIFLSISACLTGYAIYNIPFIEIPKTFSSEWIVICVMLVVCITAVIWKNSRIVFPIVADIIIFYAYVYYMIEDMGDIEFLAVGANEPIAVLMILFFLSGVFIPAGFALWKKNDLYFFTPGILLSISSILVDGMIDRRLILFPLIAGLAYAVYMFIKKKGIFLFWPILQIYILVIALNAPLVVSLIIFMAALAYGVLSYPCLIRKDEYGLDVNWFILTGVIPILEIMRRGNDKWLFCSIMMTALLLFGISRKLKSGGAASRTFATIGSVVASFAILVQPFFEIRDDWYFEWFLVCAWAVVLFNMFVLRHMPANVSRAKALYICAIVSVIIQGINVLSENGVAHALILGISMASVLVVSFMRKKKRWFFLSGITLILQVIYSSRQFWKSIAWWVYLLLVGVILIFVAAFNEYKKRNMSGDDTNIFHVFDDWDVW